MLNILGDILNWLAAGVVFPLMALPIAALISEKRITGALVWFGLVSLIVIAGGVFAALAPALEKAPAPSAMMTFAGIMTALFFSLMAAGGPARVIARLLAPIEAAVTGAGRAVMWLLIVMALVQFVVVILRYVFGVNFIFMQESVTYLHGAVFLIAAGYALISGDHVRVDIFYREARPGRKALIDFIGTYLLLLPVCVLLVWAGAPYIADSWAVREGSTETSGIQAIYLLKSCIAAFALLMSLAGFVIATRAGEILKGRA